MSVPRRLPRPIPRGKLVIKRQGRLKGEGVLGLSCFWMDWKDSKTAVAWQALTVWERGHSLARRSDDPTLSADGGVPISRRTAAGRILYCRHVPYPDLISYIFAANLDSGRFVCCVFVFLSCFVVVVRAAAPLYP